MGLDILIYKTTNKNYFDDYLNYLNSDSNEDFDDGEEVCYFRKKNMLIPFLRKHVGIDDKTYISRAVSKKVFELLIYTIDELLASIPDEASEVIENPPDDMSDEELPYYDSLPEEIVKKCEELLPTQSGFFFGNTDYDIFYVWSLQQIKEDISKLLESFDDKCFYHFIFDW